MDRKAAQFLTILAQPWAPFLADAGYSFLNPLLHRSWWWSLVSFGQETSQRKGPRRVVIDSEQSRRRTVLSEWAAPGRCQTQNIRALSTEGQCGIPQSHLLAPLGLHWCSRPVVRWCGKMWSCTSMIDRRRPAGYLEDILPLARLVCEDHASAFVTCSNASGEEWLFYNFTEEERGTFWAFSPWSRTLWRRLWQSGARQSYNSSHSSFVWLFLFFR